MIFHRPGRAVLTFAIFERGQGCGIRATLGRDLENMTDSGLISPVLS
jgi:hypothetical protein